MYRLSGRLEASELSELYRADRDGTNVVIKLFHARTTDLHYAKVVADTARRLRGVSHPGVSHVLDVGLVDQRLAIVRDELGRYSLGLALSRLLTREVYLPPPVALSFIVGLLEVMDAAHQAGVVHGLLTPGNVVLTDDGSAGVTDFGALDALVASTALSRTFLTRGRKSYRAPELKATEPGTVAGDIYAIGAMAYELLTLREPSTGAAAVSTRNERLPPPSRLVRALHSRIDPIIMRALDPGPTRRFKSCGDFARALREFLSAQGGMPGKDDVLKFVAELFPRDMVMDSLGPVPFDRPFHLDDITGVAVLEALNGVATELPARPPFSGGQVDDRTPTSDGLPVFTLSPPLTDETTPDGAPVTQLELPAQSAPVQAWHAPEAAVAAPAAGGPGSAASRSEKVLKRVKALEDFAPDEDRREQRDTSVDQPAVQAPKAPKTFAQFAFPFRRDSDAVVPSLSRLFILSAKRARFAAVVGAVALIGTLLFFTWAWLTGFTLLPRKGEDKTLLNLSGQGHAGAAKPMTAADLVKPRPKPRPESPPEARDCYSPPKGGGFVSVASPRAVRVEIDGERVCGSVQKVVVAPGTRKVRIVDVKSGEEYVSTPRVQSGKVAKIIPMFKTR